MELIAGQNVPVDAGRFSVRLTSPTRERLDLVALVLDDQGHVAADEDFVFYNAPRHPSGGVTLSDQQLDLDLQLLPPDVGRVVVAVNSEGEGGRLEHLIITVVSNEMASFTPSGLRALSTAVLVEFYRRSGGWRLRAVGQGWTSGLVGLATDYGVNVDGESDEGNGARAPEPDDTLIKTQLESLIQRRQALVQEIYVLEGQVRRAREAIVETDELRLLQQVGYYQFRHPLDDVLASKQHLDVAARDVGDAADGWEPAE